jgi:hypothetical protein
MTFSSTQPCHSHAPCCQSCVPSDRSWEKKIELVAVVALSIFAGLANPWHFVISASLGVVYQCTKVHLKFFQPESGENRPGCAQGYGEFFSGVKLWPIENIVLITLLAWEHLRMHPHFYAPFFGFFAGMRISNLAIEWSKLEFGQNSPPQATAN